MRHTILLAFLSCPKRCLVQLNAYCLNFNGRVTEASVKNFQLVSDENHNHVILQFGKVRRARSTTGPDVSAAV